jgi:prophage antirepressor-like protein
MNALQVFKTPNGSDIRVSIVNGEPLFVAKDVAERIGYTWNGTARIEHVPEEWRGVTSVVTPSGNQNMAVLAEPGLYFFLARSDKPAALPFQKWIAGEVIPSIRKTGSYSINKKSERQLSAALVAELRKVYGSEEASARIDYIIGFTNPAFSGHAGNYSPEFITAYRKCRDYIQAIDRGASIEEVEKTVHGETGACSVFIEMGVRFARAREGLEAPYVYEPSEGKEIAI